MENRINIGELDTLVTLQTAVQTIGAQGESVTTFRDHSRVYAKVDRTVNEMVSDGNYEAGQDIALTVYKVPSLTTRWRVVVDGKPYEIRSIDPVSRVSPLCTLSLAAIE
jgi:head-tail adaptor